MTAWIITEDKVADADDREDHEGHGGCNLYAVGLTGPQQASERDVERLKAGEGIEFRLLDDDREVYYVGRRLETSDADARYPGEPELAPLMDFGMPNAGAVIQEEKNANGEWEAIN